MDDTKRPSLSRSAQAVLDAYDLASDGNYINGEWIQDHAGQVAAALRAAADQVEHHWDGMECVDHLQAIAAELEGAAPAT